MSNNAPEISLELTKDQAQFLMKNCDSNLAMCLGLLMQAKDRTQAEKLIELNENFKEIRRKLLAQGIKSDG